MSIRHIVSWKLAAEDAQERREQAFEIARLLRSLLESVTEIRSLEVGINVLHDGENFDVVLIADFDDAEALQRYAVHPAHREVAGYIRSVVAARSAVDFAVDD